MHPNFITQKISIFVGMARNSRNSGSKKKIGAKVEKETKKVKDIDKILMLERFIYPSLSAFETILLIATWVIFILCSWYLAYRVSQKQYPRFLRQKLLVKTEFNQVIEHLADYGDREWNVFSDALTRRIPWILFHFLCSQLLRKWAKNSLPLFNVLLSTTYLCTTIGCKPTIWLFCQPISMFLAHLSGSSLLVWMVTFVMMFVMKPFMGPLYYMYVYFVNQSTNDEYYVITVTWYWVSLRCVSYCLDRIWNEVKASSKGKFQDLIEMIAYCFYLPTNISGPIMIYKDFQEGFNSDYKPWTQKRLAHFLLQILRYTFWLLIGHLMLHFFHQSLITSDMDILRTLDYWTGTGVVLVVGGFFYLKYVIFYGWPRPFVVEDGMLKAPKHPVCIYRIHRYSEMWRNFDHGLYQFLKKYIYLPIIGTQGGVIRKVIGPTITFSFIYLWHGTSNHIFLWSVFNYLSVMTEMIGSELGKYPPYSEIERKFLSPLCQRRFHAMLGAPLLLGSVLANFYFFMGSEVGHYIVYRAFTSWPIDTPLAFVISYVCAQISIEVKNWELRREIELNKPKSV